MPKPKSPPPPLSDRHWGAIFCSKQVQSVLKEARKWKLPQRILGTRIHHSFDTACAFGERPHKYFEAVVWLDMLRDYSPEENAWFFRLCAAVCDAAANPTTADRICEASNISASNWIEHWRNGTEPPKAGTIGIKEIADRMGWDGLAKVSPNYVSNILMRERNRRGKILLEWRKWDPNFFNPLPASDLFKLENEYIRK